MTIRLKYKSLTKIIEWSIQNSEKNTDAILKDYTQLICALKLKITSDNKKLREHLSSRMALKYVLKVVC